VKRIRTSLLSALLIAAIATAWVALVEFQTARDRADVSASSLEACRAELSDLRSAGASRIPAISAPGGPNQVGQILREAAASAGAAERLTSIEPGQTARLEGTDYQETPVFLRLESLTMKQLVTFLHQASTRDTRAHCRSIELSPAPPTDAWSADVTIGYLSFSPRKGMGR
jgi:hypothetical protein